MKKTKKLLVVVLALILFVLSIGNTTFSWFDRPKTQQGNTLQWKDIEYKTSVGDGVYMNTYESADGVNYSENPVTDFSNDTAIPKNQRRWYRTDIINTSTHEQFVSLYLSKLKITSETPEVFYIGVNKPTRSYRNLIDTTVSNEKTSTDTMRIYFQHKNFDKWQRFTTFCVCYGPSGIDLGSKGEHGTYVDLTYIGQKGSSNHHTYYADIPATANKLFFCGQGWADINESGVNIWNFRTQTFTDLASDGQSKIFYLEGWNNNNANAKKSSIDGANIVEYYKEIVLHTDETFTPEMKSGTDYIGKTIEYYSGNENVFTVNKTTGEITPVGAGEAILYTKVIGNSYEDSKQVETKVRIKKRGEDNTFYDVPIVTNFKIAPGTDSEDNVTKESVYWYIKDHDETGTLTYNIDGIYLTR